ncbi:MAG: nitrilase-related carbon-nitrogen hydrolase [Chitinophagaceae bacterium]
MKKIFKISGIVVLLAGIGYFVWSNSGRTAKSNEVALHIDTTFSVNSDSGKGNVIGINPFMIPEDYSRKDQFIKKIKGYLDTCQSLGWLNDKTTVVLPEYIGSWLAVEGEKNQIYQSEHVTQAIGTFISSNLFSYIHAWLMCPDDAEDKVKHSVFAMKGQHLANLYLEIFSQLSREYGITIIAGSILLPNPEVRKGKIITHKGSLENVSAVFDPKGNMYPVLTRKSYPTKDELLFIKKSLPTDPVMYDLPIGKTAVMICADSWYPESYLRIKNGHPLFVAVPSYTQKDFSMMEKWEGYSGSKAPKDVDSKDIGTITLRDAWLKYTIPARIKESGASYGMIVNLRGTLWDLGTDGELMIYNKGNIIYPTPRKGASIINLWLN